MKVTDKKDTKYHIYIYVAEDDYSRNSTTLYLSVKLKDCRYKNLIDKKAVATECEFYWDTEQDNLLIFNTREECEKWIAEEKSNFWCDFMIKHLYLNISIGNDEKE